MDANQILKKYGPWTKKLARYLSKFHNFPDVDDLEQEANITLLKLAKQFDPNKNICFKIYAFKRVIGRMKDYIRKITHSRRMGTRSVETMPLLKLLSYCPHESSENPETITDTEDSFNAYFKCLSNIERKIIYYYHHENLSFKKMSPLVGMSESRCTQIHHMVIDMMRARLRRKPVSISDDYKL